uniref:Uncharacterized protein n=1 Tax=Panagrolaimus sp. PS1159 TaxID=55785 RepID=A0AC35GQH9_9BILA
MASTLRKRCLESFGSKDLFYIFGFTSDIEQVTEDQINQAYKARVRLYHPDKHATGSEKEKFNAAEKFKIFTEAKNVLLNFEKREFYLSTGRLDDEEDQSDDEEAESDDDLEPPVLEQQCVLKSEEANESFESDGITSDDNAEEQFEVEKILAKRKRNGKIEYCIKWKDYGSEHNSWEKIDNCDCPDLIKEFEGAFSPNV